MFRHGKLEQLNDFFAPLSQRREGSVYFCRLDGCSQEVITFLKGYYEAARRSGVILDGRIPNPDVNNLSYFSEMMGDDFRLDPGFLSARLQKWLPRMSPGQRENVTAAMYATLEDMLRQGKNENMLRNAYIKYMCWLYYKFERIVNQLGAEHPPKILYDGAISNYELQLLIVLSRAGADILLVERQGDGGYRKLDPSSEYSQLIRLPGLAPFPDTFSLKWLQGEIVKDMNRQRLYGTPPALSPCTNAWMKKAELNQALTPAQARGSDSGLFYNSFILQRGVEDKLIYSADLFAFYKQLNIDKRRLALVSGGIPSPTPDEISAIQRKNYNDPQQLAADLARNIQFPGNEELRRLMAKAFLDIVLEESDRLAGNVTKLTNKAVYLLCWLKRYQKELFSGWKPPEVSVFLLFGKCSSDNEVLFLRLLAKLPVDVLVLLPDLNMATPLQDPSLLELKYDQSLPMEAFPAEQGQTRVRTAAYQAERELDTLMYQDTGIYRNQQYAKAESVTLQVMYEEIAILWDQELKYRPSFGTSGQSVTIPVLLEKISGVKSGQLPQYWQDIKKLITPDTMVVSKIPWLAATDPNPIKPFATQFLQNGKLLRNKIKSHKAYPYGILRNETQEHLLDKLQLLLDQRTIHGTYQNGTEYTIISTALNLPKDLLRMIQKFDFTKKNPKLVIINTTEQVLSLEDSILVAFLNLVGFDILFFVPTGYQCIEGHFRHQFANEQQLGEYLYDLSIPNFRTLPNRPDSGFSSIRKLFGRSI